MPWNEPGGSKNNEPKGNNPWGDNKNNQSPPDLDKIIAEFIKRLRGIVAFKKNGSQSNKPKWQISSSKDHHYGIGVTLGVLFLIWVLSGLFIVNPAEEAVVLRFGKYADVLQPGLHWMARFIDKKYLVDVKKIYSFSLHGDFLTKSSDQNDLPNQYIQVTTKNILNDQSKNLVNVELNVQYRISDPRAYLFNVINPDETVQQVAAGALSDVIGTMKLDDVLTTGRDFVSSGVLERTKQVLATYNAGVEIVAVSLRKVQAPDQVRNAFSDVNRADQDRSTTIQQAQAYASKVLPIAQGAAARILADANGYQQQVVLTAQADVAKYQALLKAYTTAPEVTRERMYLETIQKILSRSTKILVDNSNNMLYLPLDKLLKEKGTLPDELNENTRISIPLAQNAAVANVNPQNGGEVKNVSE